MSFNLPPDPLDKRSEFVARHVGIDPADERHMLQTIGAASRAALIETVVPVTMARRAPMLLPEPVGEARALAELRTISDHNRLLKSCIGQGYHGTHTPGVILRNVLENPAWYTAYTPYQPEISQGRLEALINFQTVMTDLTGLPVANASLLDEATAAAEAMTLMRRASKAPAGASIVIDSDVLPQTRAVVQTRAEPLGIPVVVADLVHDPVGVLDGAGPVFGVIVQFPGT